MSGTIVDGPAGSPATFLFAHGAGVPMDGDWMNVVTEGLAQAGIRVVRFEFPYMAGRRVDGKRRGPDRPAVLEQTWDDQIANAGGGQSVFVGGKSMGGRVASMVADAQSARGLVCFGYPFHPPGKPDKTRTGHLAALSTPALVLQGERDPFGRTDEVAGYELSSVIRVNWLSDGDHSFKPRKSSGRTLEDNIAEAVRLAAGFMLAT